MGNCRFLYNNLVPATGLSLSTVFQCKGFLSAPYKEGAGFAGLTVLGRYDYYQDLDYIVEIDATDGGKEIAQAEFKWSDSNGATWNQTTQLTAITTLALSHNAEIKFTTGVGNDCELGDKWYFKGINLYNPSKLVDGDPNTKWKTATGSSYYVLNIDLGAASSINAFAIANHNLTADCTVTFFQHDSSNFATIIGDTTYKLAYNAGAQVYYISGYATCQYWALYIYCSAVTNVSWEIGELFMGRYWEPVDNFAVDSRNPISILTDYEYSGSGNRKDIFRNSRKSFNLSFPYMTSTERDNFETMIDTIGDSTSRTYRPVFFNMDSTDLTKTWLVKVKEGINVTQHKAKYSIDIDLEEMVENI